MEKDDPVYLDRQSGLLNEKYFQEKNDSPVPGAVWLAGVIVGFILLGFLHHQVYRTQQEGLPKWNSAAQRILQLRKEGKTREALTLYQTTQDNITAYLQEIAIVPDAYIDENKLSMTRSNLDHALTSHLSQPFLPNQPHR